MLILKVPLRWPFFKNQVKVNELPGEVSFFLSEQEEEGSIRKESMT